MRSKMGLLAAVAIFCTFLSTEAHRRSTFGNYSSTESLMQMRCHVKCLDKPPNICNMNTCLEQLRTMPKFGICPPIPMEDEHLFGCRDACHGMDWRCSDAQKCCRQSCGGSVCLRPMGVDRNPFLPPMPYNLQLKEKRPGVRTVEISWEIRVYINRTGLFDFLIEGRSHIGPFFSDQKLGPWNGFPVQPIYDIKYRDVKVERKRHVGNIKLRPGRWYQFRVAAVSENGTRGYSSYSIPFQLTENVRLVPPPQNLTFGPLRLEKNATISTIVAWRAPDGEKIPITKYKISWFLRGKRRMLPNNQSTVPQSVKFMEIGNLQPNAIYCVHVQAIAGIGKNRSKSRRETKLLNTTIPGSFMGGGGGNTLMVAHQPTLVTTSLWTMVPKDAMMGKLEHGIRHTGHGITMRYLTTKLGELIVKASWPGNPHESYSIDLCRGKHCLDNPDTGEYRSMKTHVNSLEFINLKFATLYSIRLRVTNHASGRHQNIVRTFSTPLCENFRRKHGLSIPC